MSLLVAIILGLLIGGMMGYFVRENIDSLIINCFVGLVGSLIGLGLYTLMGSSDTADQLISVKGVVVSAICAVIALLMFNGLQRILPRRTASQSHVEASEIDED
ncbi:MAG: hypothetical protein JWN38_674 [Candidatus Saccharibacteria bacterium]|nr:hypothetical protein [Candidatus Saccharibacteria bacterium]